MSIVRDRDEIARVSIALAEEAADFIMGIYARDFAVTYKRPDDPVTEADHGANAIIVDALMKAFPGIPVVAEESDPARYAGFHDGDAAFFVDPVDGTRDFVGKTGEFTVMIGFAEKGRATVGVVVWPTEKRTFVGIEQARREERGRAYERAKDGSTRPIHVTAVSVLSQAKMLVTRSRRTPDMLDRLGKIGAKELVPCGSSGLKGALVAAGEADLYAHPAPLGKRWDTCAAEALVRAAGGEATDIDGRILDNASADLANRRGFVASNGHLHRSTIERLDGDVGGDEE